MEDTGLGLTWILFLAWLAIGIWIGTKMEAAKWRRNIEEDVLILSKGKLYKVTKDKTVIVPLTVWR